VSRRRHGTARGVEWELDLGMRNRLHVKPWGISEQVPVGTPGSVVPLPEQRPDVAFVEHDDRAHWSITWGNGNSDPVWGLYFDTRVPRWLGRRLER
jgi:hypothetical protein